MSTPDAGFDVGEVDKFYALSQEIENCFYDCHRVLEIRKNILLEEVRKMKELYQKHGDIIKALEQIENIKKATNELLTENSIVENKQQVVSLWDDKIRDLKKEKERLGLVCEVKLVSNLVELEYCVNTFHLRECVVEFSKRREPLVMKRITNEGENITGFGLAVDKETNLLYVTDFFKDLVHIFSQEGELLKCFGHEKLNFPYGISLSEEYVYVSDRNSIFKFVKSGEYVNDTNSSNIKFDFYPHGIFVYLQSVYVCNSGRDTIEIFNSDLIHTKPFGEDKLKYPSDIRAHKDKIFVLTRLDKIHAFDTYHNYLYSFPLNGYSKHTCFFTIYLIGNFIISDREVSCLKVFNSSGEYIDSLGVAYLTSPRGVDTDCNNRIVSVSISFNHIQIY